MARTMKTDQHRVHDLGGREGFGGVQRDGEEKSFHERWEASVFAMASVGQVTSAWNNTDRFRHAVERIDPVAYMEHGYYGRWLGGIETLLVEAGVISQEELNQRCHDLGAPKGGLIASRPKPTADPMAVVSAPSAKRPEQQLPKFKLQQTVVAVAGNGLGHTRLPRYAWGKKGVIAAVHGNWVFPDTNAHGLGECPQVLYTVCFKSTELFAHCEQETSIHLDLFEPYLLEIKHE
jgi:nitrile hydratase